MFRRKSSEQPTLNPESSSTSSGDQLRKRQTIPAQEIGHTELINTVTVVPVETATAVVEAKIDVPSAEMVQEAARQTLAIDATYEKLIVDAATNGASIKDIQKSMIDGWNSGTLPRVVLSSISRGSGVRLFALRNEVPADFFEVCGRGADIRMPGQTYASGSEQPVQFRLGSLPMPVNGDFLEPGPYDNPDPTNPSAFYAEAFTFPQIIGDARFSAVETGARLAEVNAMLAPPAAT